MKQHSQKHYADCLISSIIVLIIVGLIYITGKYAPFGSNSLATMDANIQYLDLFAYFKDVLQGKNSLSYSFGKTLGGNNIATYSYYLSSPLNFLVIFFSKDQLHVFFDLILALKLAISAFTFNFYLKNRFSLINSRESHRLVSILLSVSYGLSQYPLAQASNIMWLDAVYMLPLIMLGIYKLTAYMKGTFLSVVVGLSILFNWYTAGISCLFTFIWLIFEIAIESGQPSQRNAGNIIKIMLKYVISMLLGVMLSFALFLPTIAALSGSSEGTLDLSMLTDISFNGPLTSAIQGYSIGAKSALGDLSLFCGSLVLIGCISILFDSSVSFRIRTSFFAVMLINLMLFYWKPLYTIFSLFKVVKSYWYRHAYLGIFVLVFTAAYYYFNYAASEKYSLYIKISLAYSVLLLALNHFNNAKSSQLIYETVFFLIMTAVSYSIYICLFPKKRTSLILFLCIFLAETFTAAKIQMKNYSVSDAAEYRQYVSQQQKLIEQIKNYDNSVYRISQTFTRHTRDTNLTANYNEALAYNFMSVSGYTSTPDDTQKVFLSKLGYRRCGGSIHIVNTSIVGADSLLGVKYIISPYQIPGYEKLETSASGKNADIVSRDIYYNPFALPMAFKYTPGQYKAKKKKNPFLYQNEIYSKLLGHQVSLYIPVEYTCDKGDTVKYTLDIPQGNYVLYGNLPWKSEFNGNISINGEFKTAYACWLSPSVFYIPVDPENKTTEIEVSSDNKIRLKYGKEQFYALDLDVMKEIAELLNSKAAKIESFSNSKVNISVNASEGEALYVSVPKAPGWSISINGDTINPSSFEKCMYSIKLSPGNNEIEMVYHVPHSRKGIIISVLALVLIMLNYYFEKKKKGVTHE